MSVSLVKKSLDLFSGDLQQQTNDKKKKDPMKRISTKRKGVKKELKKVKNKDEELQKNKLKRKKIKSASKDLAKKRSLDNTNDNIAYMQKFITFAHSRSTSAEKIINHKQKKILEKEEKSEIPKSILFSDTDFDKEEQKDDFWD